jgi:hypothetical protein
MDITVLILLVWMHTIADFFMQTRTMAQNKSTSVKWLGSHVVVYSLPFLVFGWKFAVVTGILHFITDFITSRCTSYFYKKENMYMFFGVIGIDQAIHFTSLILAYVWLV